MGVARRRGDVAYLRTTATPLHSVMAETTNKSSDWQVGCPPVLKQAVAQPLLPSRDKSVFYL